MDEYLNGLEAENEEKGREQKSLAQGTEAAKEALQSEKRKNLERGNKFNKTAEKTYEYNEIHLENGKRLDSYVKGEAIVSRKATDIDKIKKETFEGYVKELVEKYSPGTKINSRKYEDELNGEVLEGQMYLEIPKSNENAKNLEEYKKLAEKYDVEIRFLEEE